MHPWRIYPQNVFALKSSLFKWSSLKWDCTMSLCQMGAKEAKRITCALLWNITSLVAGKPEFFPLWGVLTKMTWQFVFQGRNQNIVINSAWANTTATLFSFSALPDNGGGSIHTPKAGYFLGPTRHSVDPEISRAVVRQGEVCSRSRTDLFCCSPERIVKTTPPLSCYFREVG